MILPQLRQLGAKTFSLCFVAMTEARGGRVISLEVLLMGAALSTELFRVRELTEAITGFALFCGIS